MKFEFAKYTDVTKYAKSLSEDNGGLGEYKTYEKILVCPDTHDTWVAKILVGYNEEYEVDEHKVLIERNNISGMGARHTSISTPRFCREVLIADMEDGCNWDVLECDSIDEALESLADVFGIIEEVS